MSVSTISNSSSYSASAVQALANQRTQAQQSGGALGVAAKALGLSTSDLTTQLQGGKSLADIAQAQGVSRDNLADALKAGLPSDAASSSGADRLVDSIIDQVGPAQGPPPPPPPPPPPVSPSASSASSADSGTTGLLSGNLTSDQQDSLNSLSSLLNTDSQSLMKQLQSGTSLNDLFQGAGLNATTLASVIQDGLLVDTRA